MPAAFQEATSVARLAAKRRKVRVTLKKKSTFQAVISVARPDGLHTETEKSSFPRGK
jgi:hypothetical protein